MTAAEPRRKWAHSDHAKAWHRRDHNYCRYTMDFNPALANEIHHKELDPTQRLYAWLRQQSWGNLSDYAILGNDPVQHQGAVVGRLAGGSAPQPATQRDAAIALDLHDSRVSESTQVLLAAGLIEIGEEQGVRAGRKQRLIRVLDGREPTLFASQRAPRETIDLAMEGSSPSSIDSSPPIRHESSDGLSPYLRLKRAYLEQHPEVPEALAKEDEIIQAARARRRQITDRMERAILVMLRDEQREAVRPPNKDASAGANPEDELIRPPKTNGAESANSPLRTTEVDSDLQPESIRTSSRSQFDTPPPEIRGGRTETAPNARAFSETSESPLNPSGGRVKPSSVDRSDSGVEEPARETIDRSTSPSKPPAETVRQWLVQNLKVPVPLENREFQLIYGTLRTQDHFEQFQKAAQNQKAPRGWRVFVTIAIKCLEHHDNYMKAKAAGQADYSVLEMMDMFDSLEKKGGPS